MKDVCDYKTSKELSEKGFPIPEFEIGQYFWRKVKENEPLIVLGMNRMNVFLFDFNTYGLLIQVKKKDMGDFYFSPSFLDLSKELRAKVEFTNDWMKVSGRIESITENTSTESDLCEFLSLLWIAKNRE